MQSGIHLGMGQRERLALFSRKELLKLITVDFDEVCKFLKQLSTLGEGCRAPQFECRSRMLDGSVKVFFSRYGNFVKGLAGGWINAMTSLRRRDKYIVDDVSFVGLSIVRLVLPRVRQCPLLTSMSSSKAILVIVWRISKRLPDVVIPSPLYLAARVMV